MPAAPRNHHCPTCQADLDSEPQPGRGKHLGSLVHLLDTGPRHDQVEAHPVRSGSRYRRTVGQVRAAAAPRPADEPEPGTAPAGLPAGVVFWTDYSEWQGSAYNSSYPYPFASYRVSLGLTLIDAKVGPNTAWCHANSGPGKRLLGHQGYHVWYPGNEARQATTFLSHARVDPYFVAMIDVETWSGAIRGDHSAQLTILANALAKVLGQNRVKVYGNQSDLNELYPNRPRWLGVQKAKYSSQAPAEPWQGWQYSDGQTQWPVRAGWPRSSAPAGAADHNAYLGTHVQFAKTFGIIAGPAPTPKPTPTPTPVPTPTPTPTPTPVPSHNGRRNMPLIISITPDKGQGTWSLDEGGLHWVATPADLKALEAALDPSGQKLYTPISLSWADVSRRLREQAGPGGQVLLPPGITLAAETGQWANV